MKKLAEFVIRYRWAVIVFFLGTDSLYGLSDEECNF